MAAIVVRHPKNARIGTGNIWGAVPPGAPLVREWCTCVPQFPVVLARRGNGPTAALRTALPTIHDCRVSYACACGRTVRRCVRRLASIMTLITRGQVDVRVKVVIRVAHLAHVHLSVPTRGWRDAAARAGGALGATSPFGPSSSSQLASTRYATSFKPASASHLMRARSPS